MAPPVIKLTVASAAFWPAVKFALVSEPEAVFGPISEAVSEAVSGAASCLYVEDSQHIIHILLVVPGEGQLVSIRLLHWKLGVACFLIDHCKIL